MVFSCSHKEETTRQLAVSETSSKKNDTVENADCIQGSVYRGKEAQIIFKYAGSNKICYISKKQKEPDCLNLQELGEDKYLGVLKLGNEIIIDSLDFTIERDEIKMSRGNNDLVLTKDYDTCITNPALYIIKMNCD